VRVLVNIVGGAIAHGLALPMGTFNPRPLDAAAALELYSAAL
jgi:hypothetical protein